MRGTARIGQMILTTLLARRSCYVSADPKQWLLNVPLTSMCRIHCPPPRPLCPWNHQPTSTQRTRYHIGQGVTMRCRLSWLTNSALVYGDGGVGDCGVSAYDHSCAHGAQIYFGDITAYLTYGIGTDVVINYCLSTVSLSFRCEFSSFLIVSAYYIILKEPAPRKIAKYGGTHECNFYVAFLVNKLTLKHFVYSTSMQISSAIWKFKKCCLVFVCLHI
jgi:hypothetical protein